MAANPKTFDYYRVAELLPPMTGKVNTTTFDYFMVGEFIDGGGLPAPPSSSGGVGTGAMSTLRGIYV